MPLDLPDWRCANDEYYDGYECQKCNTLCLSCDGPLATDCTACPYQYSLLINGQCITDSVTPSCPVGTIMNYLFQCVEQCDAAVHNYGTLECHDSTSPNTAGNGCDAACAITDGWSCWKP